MSIAKDALPRHRSPAGIQLALLISLLTCAGGMAVAESELVLPVPVEFGTTLPALTYNLAGKPNGTAMLSITPIDEHHARILGTATLEGGGATRFQAKLEILPDGSGLKLLHQESQSHDLQGQSMGILRVDHTEGIATCSPPPGSKKKTVVVKLPPKDRVANVGLSLLFQPLAEGKTRDVRFQILLCRDDPRVVDFKAVIVRRSAPDMQRQIVEIRYTPDLGAFISWLARAVVPDLSFWYDVTGPPLYLAHQMPLFSKGPEILIVREGVTPALLRDLP